VHASSVPSRMRTAGHRMLHRRVPRRDGLIGPTTTISRPGCPKICLMTMRQMDKESVKRPPWPRARPCSGGEKSFILKVFVLAAIRARRGTEAISCRKAAA
jgi:hypothetical protein